MKRRDDPACGGSAWWLTAGLAAAALALTASCAADRDQAVSSTTAERAPDAGSATIAALAESWCGSGGGTELLDQLVAIAEAPDWAQRLRVSDVTEADVGALPHAEGQRLVNEMVRLDMRCIKPMVRGLMDRARAAADAGRLQAARRDAAAVRRIGEANASARMWLWRFLGEALLERADEIDAKIAAFGPR